MTSQPTGAKAPLSERRFAQIVIGTVVAGFLLLAGVVAMAGWLLVRAEAYRSQVQHTYEVEARLFEFRVLFERAEGARRGYLISIRPRYLVTYNASEPRLRPLLAELRALTEDNPDQQRRLDELQPLIEEKIGLMEQSMALRDRGDLMGAVTAFGDLREQTLLDRIRILAGDMAVTEQRLILQRTERQTANARALLTVAAAGGVLMAAMAVTSLWAMRRFAGGMVRSQAELRRVNEGLEAEVAERTSDLRRANEEIQRFAYIVSHDLRSPLVNIMGFTSELEAAAKPLQKLLAEAEAAAPSAVSPEARLVVEAELPEAIDFIRSSTRKMDRLINAILKLSREGRRNLNPERLDMDALVDGVIASLHVMADDRGAQISVEGRLPELHSDRVAVEQIFSNLIENALKYLAPGRAGKVVVRGFVEGARRIYEVQDNGRGIDPKDHERIFELFRRAGAQDQLGEGIGLAHVRALAYRLGGLVDCWSELDQGATFRLSLPFTSTIAPESAA